MTIVYSIVALIFSSVFVWKHGFAKISTLRLIAPYCLIISLLDAAGSILYLHANADNVMMPVLMLLASLATPFSLIASVVLLKSSYRVHHYLGAFFAVFGIALLCGFQIWDSDHQTGPFPWLGYALAVLSAFLYGVSNVVMELALSKNFDPLVQSVDCEKDERDGVKEDSSSQIIPMLALNSTLSALWSAMYLVTCRWNDEVSFVFKSASSEIMMLITVYSFFMVIFYSLLPVMLSQSSAALFNLSLLTSNLFSIPIGVLLLDHKILHAWFILPFFVVLAGIIVFNL